MDTSLKVLQIIRAAMLAAIVLYAVIAHMLLPRRPTPEPVLLYIVALLSVIDVMGIVLVRQLFVSRSLSVLATQPTDTRALSQWRAGYLLTYCLSEAIAVLGLVLNALGYTIRQATPFYVAGFALICFSAPAFPRMR